MDIHVAANEDPDKPTARVRVTLQDGTQAVWLVEEDGTAKQEEVTFHAETLERVAEAGQKAIRDRWPTQEK